jgi:hypothetical protein
MDEYEELVQEVAEILRNARASRLRGEITREEEREVTRIPLMDLSIAEQEVTEQLRHVTEKVRQKGCREIHHLTTRANGFNI